MFWFWFSLFPVCFFFLTHQGISPEQCKKKVSFHFLFFAARRLESHKELDLDDEDFAKLQHFSLPPMNIERPATYKQRTVRPLRRCQSARAHFQGHTRSRSLGRRDSNQSQVAFSSTIVSMNGLNWHASLILLSVAFCDGKPAGEIQALVELREGGGRQSTGVLAWNVLAEVSWGPGWGFGNLGPVIKDHKIRREAHRWGFVIAVW